MRRESDTLRPGDRAPEFTLQDASGHAYSLHGLLSARADLEGRPLQTPADVPAYEEKVPAYEREHGKLLLVFDRGTW